MASFLSLLGNVAFALFVTAYIIFLGWLLGNAIEYALRSTIRDEIRDHEERQRRIRAEIEGK